jgi:hypothetical protein
MTDKKDAILAQFFQEHEPPAQDVRFLAAALTRAQKKIWANEAALWLGGGSVIAVVFGLVGAQIGSVFVAMGPALAPVFIASAVLFMVRRMLWARA